MTSPDHHIFVSHSHLDNEFGIRLTQDLRRVLDDESAVFYDVLGGLHGGETWWDKIVEELTVRDVFIIVLSPNAMNSKWVRLEINVALNEDKYIIPILHRPCNIRADLKTIQIISFLAPQPYETAFQEVLIALGLPPETPVDHKVSASPTTGAATTLLRQIETAFAAQDWPDVIRKADYLIKRLPDSATATIYRFQGLAYLEEGEEQHAQEALETALVFVSDRELRLTLLSDYTALLARQKQWAKVLKRAREALHLVPNDPGWLATQQQAQMQLSGKISTTPNTQAKVQTKEQRPPLPLQKTKDQWLEEGNIHFNAEQYTEAIADYDQAISLDPKDDQRSEEPALEQLWYTWSTVGLGLLVGYRIRAASRGLSDFSSPRMRLLDRYLRYILPTGTDPFAITPDMAPICLSLIQTEQGERILVNKTYTGKDGVGRPGAFFVHLLANLPPDFSAAQAISLWRSPFLRSSDIDPSSGIQLSGDQLDSIPFSDLKQWLPSKVDIMHPKGINSSWMYDCFPLVIRAYLLWRRRWEQWWQNQQSEPPRLYIAAPSDMVAAFISGLTRCLPAQLLTELTFSTYEHDVRSKGQVLLLGTAWPPSPDGKINTNQDLPAVCYQEGVAINCYNYDETKTRLESDPLAISFATHATQCLAADNFLELDWLFAEKTSQTPNLNVSRFLQTYVSYIVKAQNPTQKDVELYLDHADTELLARVHMQKLILTLAARDPRWLSDFLKPRLAFLFKQSKANPKLARALAQLAKAATQKAAEAVSSDDITILNAMLSVMVQTADSQSEAWRIQPRIFAAQPNIQSFLTKHPNATFQLLEFWNQLSPSLSIDEVRPFLDVPESNFEAFYSRNLPLEWKYIATQALVRSAIAQGKVSVLGQKYQRLVAALMQHLSKTSWFEAVDLFEKLAKEGYPDKMHLLTILLGTPTSVGKESELLDRAQLNNSEYEKFLLQYGPQYLPKGRQ